MDKSADAFRTISEVADHLDTPAHVLRFWESRFPQIRPVKRAGGRRYYRPADISLLTGIKRLLHEDGMTIRGVQKILREQGVRHVSGLPADAGFSVPDETLFETTDAVVVQLMQEPVVPRPAPDLAEAMAKAMDHRPAVAPDLFTESAKPAVADAGQGALILTALDDAPVNAEQDQSPLPSMAEMGGGRDAVLVPSSDPAGSTDSLADDGFDEDFDTEPVETLASRVRSLPADASVAKIGDELVGMIARLRALRDNMADAAHAERR